jgi:homocysteine S-methyltransferase
MTRRALPQDDTAFVTDGGLETDLIFHRGVDLPEFASFPLRSEEPSCRERVLRLV